MPDFAPDHPGMGKVSKGKGSPTKRKRSAELRRKQAIAEAEKRRANREAKDGA